MRDTGTPFEASRSKNREVVDNVTDCVPSTSHYNEKTLRKVGIIHVSKPHGVYPKSVLSIRDSRGSDELFRLLRQYLRRGSVSLVAC